MDPAIIGVFIPILAIGLGIPFATYAVWTSHKQKLAKYEMQARTHKADDTQSARIEELEDRMRVLERIVTDRGFDVAHQIEALRDERRVEELIEDRSQAR
jgi:predicted house-cleaning noncanonical NTP pyrophosphatase (MazG superfamily)